MIPLGETLSKEEIDEMIRHVARYSLVATEKININLYLSLLVLNTI
jgi:hypothetical protein